MYIAYFDVIHISKVFACVPKCRKPQVRIIPRNPALLTDFHCFLSPSRIMLRTNLKIVHHLFLPNFLPV